MRRLTKIAIGFVLAAFTGFAAAADGLQALHPPVVLLDRSGVPVVQSRQPISTMRSCGGCHDTAYIAGHSFHVSLGSDERTAVGAGAGQRAWDYSPGVFGRWNPLLYRYLTPPGDTRLDLGVPEWIQEFGERHVGGGPAVFGHGAQSSEALPSASADAAIDPNTQILDATTGQPRVWDWQASGVVEMNCFLCHCETPDNAARVADLAAGRFQWAGTATLARTGLVTQTDQGWAYAADTFDALGAVAAERLGLRAPTSEHCGQCHGVVHRGSEPLTLDRSLRQWSTATKGQVFSAQRIADSAVNIEHKQELARPWDVHAETLLACASCHFSLNNPAAVEPSPRTQPAHLAYEPRRLAISDFLTRPSHQFAKGQTAQGTVAAHLAGTMRRCEDCHRAESTHAWLPYPAVHFARLSCEACHVPQSHAPAVQAVDWTMLDEQGEPRIEWRGLAGDVRDPQTLVTGFRPVLLPRQELDGRQRLVPHNLITAWFWVEGGPTPRPVREIDLKRALLRDGGWHPGVLAACDANRDGRLDARERVLDSAAKVDVVRRRLVEGGVTEPRISGEIQPYATHHGVGPARTATRDCAACHTSASRLAEPFTLAAHAPAADRPALVGDSGVTLAGAVSTTTEGTWTFQPSTRAAELYVLGHNRWTWLDVFGGLAVVGVIVGAGTHAGLRWRTRRRRRE